METPELIAFHREMRARGAYVTPPERRPARPARAGAWAAWRFYGGGLGGVVARGLREIRDGTFDDRTLATLAHMLLLSAERVGAVVSFEGFTAPELHAGPVVYAGNHMSLVETIVLPAGVMAFGGLSIVARENLARYPFFGRTLRASHPILVTRHNPRQDLVEVLRQGVVHLREGRSVLLFPQGTRAVRFDPRGFNTLGLKLAQRAGVPLVPVDEQTDFARVGRWLRDFGPVDPSRPVRFAAGPPIAPGVPPRQAHAACVAFIVERLRAWGLEPLEPAAGGEEEP